MKITRENLRALIQEAVKEANKFKKVKGGKSKAIKSALYGDPKEKTKLKDFLVEKFGKVMYCATCAAYDVSAEAKKAKVTEDVEKPSYAFCHAFGFSCKSTNSCSSYTEGGPKR